MGELGEITNFVPLTEDIGTGGQPTREQFQTIADAGYAAVVNLAMPDSDHAIPEEGSLVTALGMTFCHIPVDFAAPTVEDLRRFMGVMRAFEGRKVFVHCVVNARVSAFLYHYLKHMRKLDESACRSPILTAWEPRMDDTWRAFLALDGPDIGISESLA